MKQSENFNVPEHLKQMVDYVLTTSGLQVAQKGDKSLHVRQVTDQKVLTIELGSIVEILSRIDSDGQSFLQVNFTTGKKILLTTTLIGFKPSPIAGLDMNKLPKVVTTPDLVSVFEAIEESMSSRAGGDDLDTLKKVFSSIVAGGEMVGFDLSQERQWLWCLFNAKASA